jgi:hypothetical protein
MRRLALLVVPVLVLMVGCGDDDSATEPTSGAPTTGASATTGSTAPTSTSPSPGATFSTVPGSIVPQPSPGTNPSATPAPAGGSDEAAAIADLAGRQGVGPSAITTVSVAEVTWRDGSIGCPQPGVAYTQALVPGIRVVLELDGQRYEYHAGGSRTIFLCENPEPPLDG